MPWELSTYAVDTWRETEFLLNNVEADLVKCLYFDETLVFGENLFTICGEINLAFQLNWLIFKHAWVLLPNLVPFFGNLNFINGGYFTFWLAPPPIYKRLNLWSMLCLNPILWCSGMYLGWAVWVNLPTPITVTNFPEGYWDIYGNIYTIFMKRSEYTWKR